MNDNLSDREGHLAELLLRIDSQQILLDDAQWIIEKYRNQHITCELKDCPIFKETSEWLAKMETTRK